MHNKMVVQLQAKGDDSMTTYADTLAKMGVHQCKRSVNYPHCGKYTSGLERKEEK